MAAIQFPPEMYQKPEGLVFYGDNPDLKKAVSFFRSLMKTGEWEKRRDLVAHHFYRSLVGQTASTDDKGRLFNERDVFGWYLFLGESFTDHPQNYEVVFGCRVIPILATIGSNLGRLLEMRGFVERAQKLVNSGRAQPNGPLFEMLVAAAYGRLGADVVFRREMPGVARSHDLDIRIDSSPWAVECKRMEVDDYSEAERNRMRVLARPCLSLLGARMRSVMLNLEFKVELSAVPDTYLLEKIPLIETRNPGGILWDDPVGRGIIGEMDLQTIQEALSESTWLYPGPQYMKLLTGSYRRNEDMIMAHRVKYADNPHYIDEIDGAIVIRWASLSDDALDKKARSIIRKLAEATDQLPDDVPGVVHIGFEALHIDEVERRRYRKIAASVNQFDPRPKPLQYVYCHYLSPEASPEESWAIDETTHTMGIRSDGGPFRHQTLMLPEGAKTRFGVHWAEK